VSHVTFVLLAESHPLSSVWRGSAWWLKCFHMGRILCHFSLIDISVYHLSTVKAIFKKMFSFLKKLSANWEWEKTAWEGVIIKINQRNAPLSRRQRRSELDKLENLLWVVDEVGQCCVHLCVVTQAHCVWGLAQTAAGGEWNNPHLHWTLALLLSEMLRL